MKKRLTILMITLGSILTLSSYSDGTLMGNVAGYDKWGSDIDECKENPNICPPCMTCINIEGSYRCVSYESCDNENHNHETAGGGTPQPKPDPKYLPNKIIYNATFQPDYDQFGGTATWGKASVKFNFSKKAINTGAVVRICDYGGSENCYIGARGVFTFSDGSISEQFIAF